MGLGPEDCAAHNPRLVYARVTGWGQHGPLAHTAGHDINYIAVAGALSNFARLDERPVPPLSLVGDMGGGGMLTAFGVVCGVLEAQRSGRGQVVDAAMVDGVAAMLSMFHGFVAQGRWSGAPGANFSDTGAPYYEVYETAGAGHVAVGALESRFYEILVERLGLSDADLPPRDDPANWPLLKQRFAAVFRTKTRDEWETIFAGTDACVSPVRSLTEAKDDPHLAARGTFIERDGFTQPAPAPRFDRTPAVAGGTPPAVGQDTDAILTEHGLSPEEIGRLRSSAVVG
jgi:alpha-methylacyl-CoA racemase